MSFVDSHCHLDMILQRMKLSSPEELRSLAFPESLEACIHVSCGPDSISAALELTTRPWIFATFGIHPHDAESYDDALEAALHSALESPKALAWGEIGLDYHYNHSRPEVQRKVFIRQLGQAVTLGKPIVIHTREAEEDTLKILGDHLPRQWKLHVHCFTSSTEMAGRLLRDFPGACLGFTGVVTFPNAEAIRDVVRQSPLERMLLETDSPFMAPLPHRGKTCHPGYVPHIAQKIAELKQVSVQEVYQAARGATRRIYGI